MKPNLTIYNRSTLLQFERRGSLGCQGLLLSKGRQLMTLLLVAGVLQLAGEWR